MDLHNVLLNTLSAIEADDAGELSIDSLSRGAYVSASHLRRLFRLTTGQSLIDYARGRRLARSLDEIFLSGARVLDIALRYGFEYEQSYIRAFRREFGCTPGEAREDKRILTVRERILPSALHAVGQGLLYGPKLVMSPSFCLVGRLSSFPDFDPVRDATVCNSCARRFVQEDVCHITNPVSLSVYYALVRPNNPLTYMPSARTKDLSSVPDGLTGETVPAGLYLRFRYVGRHHYYDIDMNTARGVFNASEAFFAENTRYSRSPGLVFERIDTEEYEGGFCRFERHFKVEDQAE